MINSIDHRPIMKIFYLFFMLLLSGCMVKDENLEKLPEIIVQKTEEKIGKMIAEEEVILAKKAIEFEQNNEKKAKNWLHHLSAWVLGADEAEEEVEDSSTRPVPDLNSLQNEAVAAPHHLEAISQKKVVFLLPQRQNNIKGVSYLLGGQLYHQSDQNVVSSVFYFNHKRNILLDLLKKNEAADIIFLQADTDLIQEAIVQKQNQQIWIIDSPSGSMGVKSKNVFEVNGSYIYLLNKCLIYAHEQKIRKVTIMIPQNIRYLIEPILEVRRNINSQAKNNMIINAIVYKKTISTEAAPIYQENIDLDNFTDADHHENSINESIFFVFEENVMGDVKQRSQTQRNTWSPDVPNSIIGSNLVIFFEKDQSLDALMDRLLRKNTNLQPSYTNMITTIPYSMKRTHKIPLNVKCFFLKHNSFYKTFAEKCSTTRMIDFMETPLSIKEWQQIDYHETELCYAYLQYFLDTSRTLETPVHCNVKGAYFYPELECFVRSIKNNKEILSRVMI